MEKPPNIGNPLIKPRGHSAALPQLDHNQPTRLPTDYRAAVVNLPTSPDDAVCLPGGQPIYVSMAHNELSFLYGSFPPRELGTGLHTHRKILGIYTIINRIRDIIH
jgi:hypothetical protein